MSFTSLYSSLAIQRRFLIFSFIRDLCTLIQSVCHAFEALPTRCIIQHLSLAAKVRPIPNTSPGACVASSHHAHHRHISPKYQQPNPFPATASPEIQLKRLEPRPHPPTPRTRSPRHPAPYPTNLPTRTTKLINTVAAEPTNTLRASPTLPQQPHPPTPGAVDLDLPPSSPDASAVSEGGGGVAAVGGEAGGVHVEVLA